MLFGDDKGRIDRLVAKSNSKKLISLLSSKNKEIRLKVIEGLGQVADDHSVHALIALLTDKDANIREQAALSMGLTKKDICKTHLQNRIHNEKDDKVRNAIHQSIMLITKEVGFVN